jgi:GAG-pre-integrase domain
MACRSEYIQHSFRTNPAFAKDYDDTLAELKLDFDANCRAILAYELKCTPMIAHPDGTVHASIHAVVADVVTTLPIPESSVRPAVKKLLWHQRLGHPSDEYLMKAHKCIKGIPKFYSTTGVLNSCPTCIHSKMTKASVGSHSTRTATQPHQGISIDFGSQELLPKMSTVPPNTSVSTTNHCGSSSVTISWENYMVIHVS